MSLHRHLDWNATRRDMSRDRSSRPATGFMAARAIEAARLDRLAKEAATRPLVMNGSYDRSAIMGAAIAKARSVRAKGSKAPWSQLIASALRLTWSRAKAARLITAH